ncbi:nitrilase-related carbon-nitrogen hydrolase, partial [Halomonas campaniensis]|uniref:nitrilase-related carbon-nitrogen hydrolase n=1 Tax=Halomonas campaniensis TaxID=213554 RepID=UPI003970596A
MHYQDRLRVGAAQINAELGAVDRNLAQHLATIREACERGIELLVFPELSLTGYGLGSRVMQVAMPLEDPRLRELALACGEMQTV